MSAETVQWALSTVGGILVVLGGIAFFLLRATFRLGEIANRLETISRDLTSLKTNADKVPALEVTLGTLKEAWLATRSDIKDLLRERRGSSPGFGEE